LKNFTANERKSPQNDANVMIASAYLFAGIGGDSRLFAANSLTTHDKITHIASEEVSP
jgi:hypothetical protein